MSEKRITSGGPHYSGKRPNGDNLTHLISGTPESTEREKRWQRPRSISIDTAHDRPFSADEIREQKAKAIMAHVTKNILYLSNYPLDTISLYTDTGQLMKIHKNIAGDLYSHEGNTYEGGGPIDQVVNTDVNHKQYYNLAFATSPQTGKVILSSVFVVRNKQKIEEVLRKLHSMTVANIEEKFWVEYRLNQVLNELIGA